MSRSLDRRHRSTRRSRLARSAAPLSTVTFEDAAERFIDHLRRVRRASPNTVRAYRSDYRAFASYLARTDAPQDARQLSAQHVASFIAASEDLADGTNLRRLSSLSALFDFCVAKGWADRNAATGVDRPSRPTPRLQPMPESDVCELLAAATALEERAMLTVMVFTGLRPSELLALKCRNVDLEEGRLHVCGKGGRERTIPLVGKARDVLEAYLDERAAQPDAPLFSSRSGGHLDHSSFFRRFARIRERCGFPTGRYSPHSLRATFAAALMAGGASLQTAQRLLGHDDVRTTSAYLGGMGT